jgi:cytochrome c oxidase subunit I
MATTTKLRKHESEPAAARGLLSRPRPEITAHGIKDPSASWTSWITTTDHKKIGILYLWTVAVFFVLGGVEALLIRIQLGAPDNTFLDPDKYNQIFTMHGTTMIFLVGVPVWAGLANYLLPLMLGARDVAFPRLNAWSYWMFLFGGIALYASVFFTPPEAGWFSYVPLSTQEYSPSGGQEAWIYMVHLTGLSSLIGALNFIATVHNMRAPGMGWGRLPLFVWTMLIYSYLVILALSSLAATATMLLIDRNFGGTFFDPTQGGSALLWQHLFWFFGHPEVYILILPAFGVVSEVLPVFARKPIFGYKAIAASTAAIAFLGLLVWAHHMFATPTSTVVLAFFMLSSFVVAVPTGVKILNWVATLWRGTIEYRVALLWAAGLIGTFLIGGISGVFLAVFPIDWQLTDSYFVVAHLHYVAIGGTMFGALSALYYWFPKMSGRMLDERMGKASFWITLIGFHLTFLIQHSLGMDGMPRRIYEYSSGNGWNLMNQISTLGSFLLGLGFLLSIINVVRSLKRGAIAAPDPWKGNTLEWFTPSPPPENNFDAIPRVRSVEPMKDIRAQVERETGMDQKHQAGRPLSTVG